MKLRLLFISLFGLCTSAFAEGRVATAPDIHQAEQAAVLRFAIDRYIVDGATLLSQDQINAAVAPFVGREKDFSDVQHALEAIENAYAARGFSAVHVTLPEQALEKGTVHFRVVESRFGHITVIDNHFTSEANALNALPALRSGGVPQAGLIARELRLANENPARQMNVVLKEGEKDDEVDAKVVVTDAKPASWGLTADNTGTPETGRTRLGVSYRYANLFDRDQVASLQYLMSPERPNRLTVLSGGYKIPLYQSGDSLEFSGGYSNVNSVVGGLGNFQGGGLLFGSRYNHPLARIGVFDPRVSYGLDWRDFSRVELNSVPVTVLYNEIVVLPLSVTYAAQGKFAKSELGFNASFSANLPGMGKGSAADFASYDRVNLTRPNANYKVVRYGANYSKLLAGDWQIRAALNGQWSRDTLIQGEQMRLGGVDAVRGFSEGSESGDIGMRWNLEGYTPDFGKGSVKARVLLFFDTGEARFNDARPRSSISSVGVGLRAAYVEQFMLRMDAGRIVNTGNDPAQRAGDWRVNLGLSASY